MRKLVVVSLLLVGCGAPTGSTCSEDSTLTYENFGEAFMGRYCARCHSSALKGAARQGAPDNRNYDSADGVRADLTVIDVNAAAGPAAVNTRMPQGTPSPTEEERRKLGEWLACGAP